MSSLLAADQPSDILIKRIQKYAEMVQADGCFLEAIDAELFAKQSGKTLIVAVDYQGLPPELQRATAFWSTLLPRRFDAPLPAVNRRDPDLWCLISCSATYDSKCCVRNHWVPALLKEQLGDAKFKTLRVGQTKKLAERQQSYKLHLHKLEDRLERLRAEGASEEETTLVMSDVEMLKAESFKTLCFALQCFQFF